MSDKKNSQSNANSHFYQNVDCEFFPCHSIDNLEKFNCLFCFCPLYAFNERCGGNYTFTKDGIKDCSKCSLPHEVGNYYDVIDKIKLLYGY